MRHALLTIAVCLVSTVVAAQPADDYFPLAVGNAWTYFQVLDPPSAPPDTTWRGTYETAETVTVDDTLYYRSDYPFAPARTLRADADGRIFARVDGRDVLLFDVTLAEGAVYTFPEPGQPDVVYDVTVTRDLTIDVGAGRFEDCIRFRFEVPGRMDAGYTFAFAPGVGIVYAYDGQGDYQELYAADVGGQSITSAEFDVPVRSVEEAFAYPNPFAGTTTVVFAYRGTPMETATVYDVLGRKVATLRGAACTDGRCAFTWDGAGLPGGTYFARNGDGGRPQTVRLVVGR